MKRKVVDRSIKRGKKWWVYFRPLLRDQTYVNLCREMTCIGSRYFNLHRILLLLVGLWPYKRSKFTRVQLILFNGILMSFIIVQFTTFVTAERDPQFVIEVLSVAFLYITYAIEYISYWVHLNTVKRLMKLLQHIYDELNDQDEIAIMEKYGNMAKYHTGVLTIMSTLAVSVFMLFPFWPRIFDIVWPMNESRPHAQIYIPTEYFVDQEKYQYLIMLHTNVAFCVGSTAFLAAGTYGMSYFLHICGMFKVASYRMEKAMMICTLKIGNAQSEHLICRGIVYSINMHRKAMGFTRFFISKLQILFCLILSCGVISTSLNLFRVFQIITSGFDFEKLIIPFICLSTINLFIILANNNAQQIMDHNDDVFATVYNTQWYNASIRIQKMILFMLQKGTKSFCVTLGGLFTGSLESAAKLVSTSMSYFTVLYSTRQDM